MNEPRILSVTPIYGSHEEIEAVFDAVAHGRADFQIDGGRIICTRRDVDPTPEEWWEDELAYQLEEAGLGCQHKAAQPMGPEWLHCIDCGETWRATR